MDSNLENLIIAKNDTENSLLWNIRESIPIAEKKHGVIVKHDISIPLENMDNFIENTEKKLFSFKSLEIINFGHIGDNNLHFNVCLNSNLSVKEKTKIAKKINQIIFSNVEKFGGSISAEHGIGQLRKKELKRFKTGYEYKQMKSIKKFLIPTTSSTQGKYFSLKNPHRLHLQYYKFAHGKKVNVPSQQDTKKNILKKIFFFKSSSESPRSCC